MIDLLAWLLLWLPALAALVLLTELTAAQFAAKPLPMAGSPRTAIVVPAHDEADAIGATVAALRSAAAHARLLVVADNCGDATAALAHAAGAEVIERCDPALRGKGFALGFARDHLATEPPEIVVVVDADCSMDGAGLSRLAATAHAIGRPVQSTYVLRARPDLGAMVGLSGFAFLLRNLVRQRGLARLGAPALLTGSGMAFPWPAFEAAPLATDALAEDLHIGIELARQGRPPAYLPDVTTWSGPARRAATTIQRSRWEQGFLRTALAAAWPLLRSGRAPLVWLGLHCLVPPLALLVAAETLALIVLGGLIRLGATRLPLALLSLLVGLQLLMLLLSWARFGRAQISGLRLLLIPFYIAWKLPLYAAAALRPERRWIRTDRN